MVQIKFEVFWKTDYLKNPPSELSNPRLNAIDVQNSNAKVFVHTTASDEQQPDLTTRSSRSDAR